MLTFDSWQRCELVRQLLNWSLPDPGERILDVGGYPGRMRTLMPQHQWIICDPLVDSPGDQVRGSSVSLPFGDESFAFAVSLDVLEHIPPEQRQAALDEMVRVSRQGLVLTFPHHDSMVESAERWVCEAYSVLHEGQEHPWLAEHARHPLPDVEMMVQHLSSYGGAVRVFDVGSVHRWVQLQMVDLFLEAFSDRLDLAKQVDEFYQERLFLFDFQPPTYRKVIFHIFAATEPITLELVHPPREDELCAEMEFQRIVTLGLLQSIIQLKKAAYHRDIPKETIKVSSQKDIEETTSTITEVENLLRKAEVPSDEDQTFTKSETAAPFMMQEYISRLEKSLELWEKTYSQILNDLTNALGWRDQLEQRIGFKLYKRLMRLLGKKIGS